MSDGKRKDVPPPGTLQRFMWSVEFYERFGVETFASLHSEAKAAANEIQRLRAALVRIRDGYNTDENTYHDNEHRASCGLMDCACLQRFINATLEGGTL